MPRDVGEWLALLGSATVGLVLVAIVAAWFGDLQSIPLIGK